MTNNIVKKIEDSLEPAPAQGEWDEVKLEEAMQRLKLLHVKVRRPHMVTPLGGKLTYGYRCECCEVRFPE